MGSLERILRLLRHRGFNVTFFQANRCELEDGLNITVQVNTERESSNIFCQLNKLTDVVEVNMNYQQKLRSCLGDG